MYINPEVWNSVRNRQGHALLRNAHEISVLVEAIATGVAIAEIHELARKEVQCYLEKEAERYLESVNRAQRRRERQLGYHPRRRRYPEV